LKYPPQTHFQLSKSNFLAHLYCIYIIALGERTNDLKNRSVVEDRRRNLEANKDESDLGEYGVSVKYVSTYHDDKRKLISSEASGEESVPHRWYAPWQER
jgi:hypothetical protein